jgi:hypothetical protein
MARAVTSVIRYVYVSPHLFHISTYSFPRLLANVHQRMFKYERSNLIKAFFKQKSIGDDINDSKQEVEGVIEELKVRQRDMMCSHYHISH